MSSCVVHGCSNPVKVVSRGLCNAHYQKLMIYGDPNKGRMQKTRPGEPFNFATEVSRSNEKIECIFWPYAKAGAGYGTLSISGKMVYAHRLVCEMVHGIPPTNRHEVAHSCGNGHLSCINPNHLRWATREDNLKDKIIHGTTNRGEQSPRAKLTKHDVLQIRSLAGVISQQKIAFKYGISQRTVWQIINRERWSWLHADEDAA